MAGDHFHDPALSRQHFLTIKTTRMEPSISKIVINTPASNRAVERIKALLPEATFYGSATLGSKRKSYIIPLEIFEQHKDKLKQLGATKARYQPFLTNPQKPSL
jgi:hypothetical protein